MSAAGCDRSDLCAELSGATDTEFHATYPDGPLSRELTMTPTAAAVVDLSPMMAGHCLLLPRHHFLSIAETLEDRSVEFASFLQSFTSKYGQIFGEYVLVEHGSTHGMNRSACVSHAHLHAVPLRAELILDEMTRDGLVFRDLAGWSDVGRLASGDLPYYLVAGASQVSVCVGPQRMQSQYFRIVVGRVLGISEGECDWSVVIRRGLLAETIERWHFESYCTPY
jgi:diadenosine tetraphosphate (Ap4A) HIT family hydrolase